MPSDAVARLRAELSRRFPTAMRRPAPAPAALLTGYPALDALLPGGGLPRGRIVEIVGSTSSGKLSIALGAMAQLTRAGSLGAFIDVTGQFFAPAAEAAGVALDRLLVVRPIPPLALEAALVVVQSRAFTLAVLDAPTAATPDRLEASHAARLRRLCEEGDTALVLLREPSAARPGRPLVQAATLRLRVRPRLEGTRVIVDKNAAGPEGAAAELRILRYASYCLRAATELRLAGASQSRQPRPPR